MAIPEPRLSQKEVVATDTAIELSEGEGVVCWIYERVSEDTVYISLANYGLLMLEHLKPE